MVSLLQRLKEHEVQLQEKSEDEDWLSRLVTKIENFINFLCIVIIILCVIQIVKLCVCIVQRIAELKTSYATQNMSVVNKCDNHRHIICIK